MSRKRPSLTGRKELNKKSNTATELTNDKTRDTREMFTHEIEGQFRIVPIPGDGNCLFNSISMGLFDNIDRHFELRTKAVDFVAANWEHLHYFTIGGHNVFDSPQAYEKCMKTNGVYGSEVEIVGLTATQHIQINVYFKNNLSQPPRRYGEEHSLEVNILYTGRNDQGHYELLKRDQQINLSVCEEREVDMDISVENECLNILKERAKKKKESRRKQKDKKEMDERDNEKRAKDDKRKEKNMKQKIKRNEMKAKLDKDEKIKNKKEQKKTDKKIQKRKDKKEMEIQSKQKKQKEMDEKKKVNKTKDSERKRKTRSNEITSEKVERLDKKRKNTNERRSNETTSERGERLDKIRENTNEKISNETTSEKGERLAKVCENTNKRRSNETPSERDERLAELREHNREVRLNKRARVVEVTTSNVATHRLAYINNEIEYPLFDCGDMTVTCTFCQSKNFNLEKTQKHKGVFSICCHNGKVKLEPLNEYPQYLQSLIDRSNPQSREFMEHIRSYNSAMAFASMGANIDTPTGQGPYCFKIHGQIYHQTSLILPNDGVPKKYAQLYILDVEDATKARHSNNHYKLDKDILRRLDTLFREINIFAQSFRMLKEMYDREEAGGSVPDIRMYITRDRNTDGRRNNLPTADEIAVVFQSSDGNPPDNRDICIHPTNGKSVRISPNSPNVDPMTYPLFFPSGERGWSLGIFNEVNGEKLTQLQFYSYRLSSRDGFNPLLNGGKLTQQFIVDAYVKVESGRLTFHRLNQKKLRVDLYSGLLDFVHNECERNDMLPGQIVILPSTFTGGPRYMQKRYQNAMAIVRKFGKPDLFITVTCNPLWPEIQRNIEPYQRAIDRPDIVSRVFHIKLRELTDDLMKKHVLGVPAAMVRVVEFQKRGLPHAHILLILKYADKIRNSEDVDKIVSAEIPNQVTHPRLYGTVKSSMIHGPCGDSNPESPCMNNGKCSKKYPREFCEISTLNINGYPLYRRRNNGTCIKIQKHTVDNRWIVPYNPYLLQKYNCHINIEICSTVKSVKYLYKYIYKGYDCANIEIRQEGTMNWNEVQKYLDTRYVSAPEAIWRLFEYKIMNQSHTIIQLAIHLPESQPVYFFAGEEEIAVERAARRNTSLTAYFELNDKDETARQYYYIEIPEHYVFVKKTLVWKTRDQGFDTTIGRMYVVNPRDSEKYHLRLLLLNTKGAKSFNDLKTVDGVICDTFKEAARRRNLLEDDSEWERCLTEASAYQMPKQLRQLMALICIFCNPTDARQLWLNYKPYMIEDYMLEYSEVEAENFALADIETILKTFGTSCTDFGLPQPSMGEIANHSCPITDVDVRNANKKVESLNTDQKKVFDAVTTAVEDDNCRRRYIFMDGPGGSGKTYLYETIISHLKSIGKSVVAVAWTGIAATLLEGGRTVHSTFKLPVPLLETSSCALRLRSPQAQKIKEADVIIWDEVTLASMYALDAIDRFLKDLMTTERPFGNKVIVLGGDFRQCLPVVKHGSRVQILEQCVKRSKLWPIFKSMKLTINERLSEKDGEFSRWLLQLGNGEINEHTALGRDCVKIPEAFLTTRSLADEIFGQSFSSSDIASIKNRAILAPTNDDVDKMNENILDRLQGAMKTYTGVDSIRVDQDNNEEQLNNYPIEFLNSLTPSGMPKHRLQLKVGAIILLLRNLNTLGGLCNGSRLNVVGLGENVITCSILAGSHEGKIALIPRISLDSSEGELPFVFSRRQFPVKLAYAMTINKAQGQTLESVGILLHKPVFSHGQLYVAFSRCKEKENIKVYVANTGEQGRTKSGVYTKNIVYKEVYD